MKPKKNEDLWACATFEGAERLQLRQTARMTLSERLRVLDEMIDFATGVHGDKLFVTEEPVEYKAGSGRQ